MHTVAQSQNFPCTNSQA